MIRRPPRSTQSRSSAASDVYKRQLLRPAGASRSVGLRVSGRGGGGDAGDPVVLRRWGAGPVHELQDALGANGGAAGDAAVHPVRPGGRAAGAPSEGVPGGGGHGADRHGNVLGGSRRPVGLPAVRRDRQAAVRLPVRPRDLGAHPGAARPGRGPVHGVPAPRGGPFAAAGRREASPPRGRLRGRGAARPQGFDPGVWRAFPGQPSPGAVDYRPGRGGGVLPPVPRREKKGGKGMIRKAVFPAAGFGTRFLPATKASPKEMLPLVDVPLIQHGVEEAKAAGVRDMIIVTGRGKNAIEDHFDVSFELEAMLRKKGDAALLSSVRRVTDGADFFYVRQNLPLGLGHAVLRSMDLVGQEPFAVVLSDDVIDAKVPVLKQMIKAYEKYRAGAVLAIQRVSRNAVSRYGIIRGKRIANGVYDVEDMVEKPKPADAPSDLAIIGRYLLPPSIFPALLATKPGAGGEIQLTDAIRSLIGTERIIGLEFKGVRYDAGTKIGFQMANIAFALKDPEIGPGLRAFLKKEILT